MATAQTSPASGAKTPRPTAAKSAARAKTTKRTSASSTSRANTSTKRSTQAVKSGTVGSYAERAVLIPVGAALIAREQVVARVNDTIDSYASPSKANAQLRKFERRGNTARSRLEREVRKTRVRVEREVRQTRKSVEREVRARRRDGEELANKVQERILSLV
jgi:hypothetical protein